MTRRAVVSLAAVLLLAVACENSDPYDSPSESFNVLYELDGEGLGGASYGTMRITSDGDTAEICWDLTIEGLPKAVQLHQDVNGPFDPVVRGAFYEPPSKPSASGCTALDQEIAVQVRERPEGFYVDGHNNDSDPDPILWAALTEAEEDQGAEEVDLDQLDISVKAGDARLGESTIVQVHIRVPKAAQLSRGLRWGDGTGSLAPLSAVDCIAGSTPDVSEWVERTKTFEHRYKRAGRFRMHAQVNVSDCGYQQMLEDRTVIRVGPN